MYDCSGSTNANVWSKNVGYEDGLKIQGGCYEKKFFRSLSGVKKIDRWGNQEDRRRADVKKNWVKGCIRRL